MTAHGNTELTPFERKFTVKGVTYVYNYELLVKQQCDAAEAVYRLEIERKKILGSTSIQEVMMTQSANYEIWVLSYILIKEISAGVYQDFPEEPNINEWEKSEQFRFAAKIPASMEKEVQEVLEDFFGKPKRFILGSLMHTRYIDDFLKKVGEQYLTLMDKEKSLLGFQDLISQVSLRDVSKKQETTEETGLSPEEMQQNSEPQETSIG